MIETFRQRKNELTWSLLLVRVCDLVEPTVADQPPVRQRQVRALGHDRLLHLHHLSHVIASGPERLRPDPLVDAGQHFRIEIVAVVDLSEVPDEVFQLHSLFRLESNKYDCEYSTMACIPISGPTCHGFDSQRSQIFSK